MRSRLGYWSPQEHLPMATRSRIGLLLSDGSVLSAYSHWDGYPSGVGKILKEHYNSYDKISELIDGGDMSHPYTEDTWTNAKRSPQPQYYSERGEDCPPRLDYSMNHYLMRSWLWWRVSLPMERWSVVMLWCSTMAWGVHASGSNLGSVVESVDTPDLKSVEI